MHESQGVAGDSGEAETDFMGVMFVRFVCFASTSFDSHFPRPRDNARWNNECACNQMKAGEPIRNVPVTRIRNTDDNQVGCFPHHDSTDL